MEEAEPAALSPSADHVRNVAAARWLAVGVRTHNVAGGGHLEIAPGHLACVLGPLARRVAGFERVVHAGLQVHVFRARLVPFWFNVTCVVDDGHKAVLASKTALSLNKLVMLLRLAGFQPTVHRTWFHRGQSLNAPRRDR